MAKALRTAAIVIGAAALVATGIGAAVGAGVIGGVAAGASTATFLGVSAATFTAIGTIAGVAAGLMSLASTALAGRPPPGTVAGNPTKFTIEKQSGIPYAMGRTLVGGRVVHRQYYGPKNVYESWASVLSLGPVKSIGPLLIDKITPVALAAGAATGAFAGHMWLDTQLGATPEARALAGPAGAIPGWDATSKLSGLAADLWTLKWDKEGKVYPTGVPVRARVVEGVFVYDPRQDSTYPGGSGPCRLGNEATYVYSENPACHAVTWAFGRYQNGVLVAGGGLAAAGIDMASFAEWANVCDANGWKVGGTVFTEADNSWDVLRMIAQAGGGECVPVAARLTAVFSAPRVSIGTITSNDVCGPVDVPTTAASRVRRNTIIPKVRLESQGWEMTPLDPVSVPEYVVLDGANRPREVEYPLVQDADQGAELALYAMLNDRELDGISIPAKIYALGYRSGDCLTIQIPEANLIGRDVILREREIEAASMAVTLTCRSETAEKHAYALGQSGTPPRTPDLSNPGVDRTAPSTSDWAASAEMRNEGNFPAPVIIVTGAIDDRVADAVVFDYRPFISGAAPDANWAGASIEPATVTRREIIGLEAGRQYEVGVRYRTRGALSDRLILGPVATPAVEVPISFTVGSHGNSAILPGHYMHGLRKQDGAPIATDYRRSYTACYYSPDTGAWTSRSFDVFGGGAIDYGYGAGIGNGDAASGSDAGSMARYLNAIPAGLPVVVFTADEPAQLRHQGGLLEAMYRCGASASKFGGDGNAFPYRAAYILVGTAGAGEGNAAIERVQEPGVDGSPNAWLMTSFTIVNGVLQLGARDGSDGRDGTDGLPGADGEDGQTSYIHYAYANSPDGQVDFTTGAPGNRAFEGVYADFVEADSGNPAAYTWREYKGPPFGMATRGTAIVAGNQVIKGEGGAADWDADAYSTVGFRGSAKMSCRFAASSFAMAGLNTDPTADTSYTSIDFAWYYQPEQNVMYAFESGVNAASLGTYDPSAIYAIEYDGVTVTYTANGVPKRQVYVGPDRTYYFDSSFLLATSRITDIEFKAGSQRPAGLTLIPQTGATITSASSVRIYGFNGGWGAGKCYSRERYGQGALAEWTIPHPGNMDAVAGLAQGIGDASYAGITFGLYVDNAGKSFAFVNGNNVAGGPTVPLDQPVRCKVAYDGKRWVRWYVNQAQIFVYDWGEQPDELMFAAALASTDPTLTEIAFSKAGANGRDGNDGAPGARGADGLTSYVHFAYANSPDGLVDFTTGAPAGHAFIGTYTDFTAADSANPASYSWIAYKGPANFGLAASGAAVVASNSLIMTGGGGWGAAGGSSTEGFRGGASASFKFPVQLAAMAGLNTDPTANNSYEGIDYAFHQSADGSVYIFESGTGINTGYPFDPNRLYQIVYNGKTVRYTIDGLQLREIPAPPNLTLFFDAALADGPPSRVTNIAFASAGQAGADGAPGANGADGTDGIDGFIVDTETPVFVIPVYSSGAIKPGWLGGVGTIKLTKGGVVIPASSYSVANNQDVTGLALAGNQFSFTGLADDAGQFDVRAVYNGQTYSRTISVKKVYDGEAAYKESASTSGTISAGPLTITGATVVPSARGCTVSSTFSYSVSAPGSFVQWRGSLSIYWRNVTDNGPWNLLETAIGSTASVVNVGTAQEPEYQFSSGSVSAAADFPAPVGDKQIGFEARLSRDVGSGSVNARGGVKLEVRS